MEGKTAGKPGPGGPSGAGGVDRLMERASRALEGTNYFEAERVSKQALERAHRAGDYEAMARIVLPLQEARRQKRQLAVASGHREAVWELQRRPEIAPGCYLIQPPLLGVDARMFREVAESSGSPVLALAREPLARDGKWPVVVVADGVSVRTKVDPPWPVSRVEKSPTKDEFFDGASRPPPREWFEGAEEALGDAAILKLKADEPAAWRVDDLLRYLDAHPSHEKLHQRLAEECRLAARENLPEERRHRPSMDDVFEF